MAVVNAYFYAIGKCFRAPARGRAVAVLTELICSTRDLSRQNTHSANVMVQPQGDPNEESLIAFSPNAVVLLEEERAPTALQFTVCHDGLRQRP